MSVASTVGRAALPPHRVTQPALLIGGIAGACALRVAAGGSMPAGSYPAAIVFAAALVALAVGSGFGWHAGRSRRPAVVLGVAGAALLVAAWATAAPRLPVSAGQHLGPLLVWTSVVAAVAAAEEIVLRGALFSALLEWRGAAAAVAVTSVVFGLMHVPLYGWGALPLDLAAGVLFAGLRLLSGGVTAPLVAHVLADLAGGWLG